VLGWSAVWGLAAGMVGSGVLMVVL
jgi:tetrahydromethanopterin S-methyltransferase subunit F